MTRTTAVLAAAALAAFASAAGAAPAEPFKPKRSKLSDAEVDKAIKKGIEFLKTASSPESHHELNSDSLILYTLYHGGCPTDDPVFQSYLKKVVDKPAERTYYVAIAAMCLSELDRTGYLWKLEEYAQFLVNTQCQNGQWSYGESIPLETRPPPPAGPAPVVSGAGGAAAPAPLYGTRHPAGYRPPKAGTPSNTTAVAKRRIVPQRRRGPEKGDNSNSQYAALGLRACFDAGLEADPKCTQDALKWWLEAQCGDGGWNYSKDWNWETDGSFGWGSMTVGGVGAVVIYKYMLGQPFKNDINIVKGVDWLSKQWDLTCNPKAQDLGAAGFHYYYLYGLERVGMLYGTDLIGPHDWYDEGGAYLLRSQLESGAWKGEKGVDVNDTCFAILFLRRATKAIVESGGRR